MKLKNVFNGVCLCSFVSLAFAGDGDVFQLKDDSDIIQLQENRINYGEVPVKGVIKADLNEIEDKHPLSDILDQAHHPRDEEFKADDHQNDAKPVVPGSSLSEESNRFAFLSIKEVSKQQLFALTAGAMFVGYCLYKIWDMFTASVEEIKEELKITLTHQDRDILFVLLQAMVQDIENLRENKHEVCAVGQVDLSPLSEIIAPECKALCHNFVELYNAIDSSGNNIEFIIMFYGQFERAVQALLLQAEII